MLYLKTSYQRSSVAFLLQMLKLAEKNQLCWFWRVCSIQESTLTYDTQFCTGKNDAVSVFRYTLIHASIRQADVRYRERALL